jgi:hypothetical protein
MSGRLPSCIETALQLEIIAAGFLQASKGGRSDACRMLKI